MIGMNINEFIDKVYYGDELEFVYAGITYFVQGFFEDGYYLTVDYWTDTSGKEPNHNLLLENVYSTREQRSSAFEWAKIFNGKTIYEVECKIEVLFG